MPILAIDLADSIDYQLMAQYKHDRFFKFYVQALYKTKGETRKDIKVMNDEDLEIDCMFVVQSDKWGWQQEDLGLFVGVASRKRID
jgi:hypothetical protein